MRISDWSSDVCSSDLQQMRERIRAETGLTASAGVSYNKFLAKLASDQNKPDGLCVVRPEHGAAFVAALPVRRFHGVGPVTTRKMQALGIETGARSEEHTSELQSLMRISYAVFSLK